MRGRCAYVPNITQCRLSATQSLHFFYGKGEDGRMIVHKGTRPLFTQRLRLRRFTADDAAAMIENWAGDERVTRYLTWDAHKSPKDTERLLRLWYAALFFLRRSRSETVKKIVVFVEKMLYILDNRGRGAYNRKCERPGSPGTQRREYEILSVLRQRAV